MRFWCVPSATDLDSPKLPPRINRDVYLRSPPPPPRLSKEEKVARGVPVHHERSYRPATAERALAETNRIHRKKKKRKKKVPSTATAGSTASSENSAAVLQHYQRLPPLPEGYSSLQTRRSKPRMKASAGVALSASSVNKPVSVHERSASMGELSTFKAVEKKKKKDAMANGDKKSSSSSIKNIIITSPPVIDDETPQPSSLVLHPGKSRSRERKNKLRKKGRKLFKIIHLGAQTHFLLFAVARPRHNHQHEPHFFLLSRGDS